MKKILFAAALLLGAYATVRAQDRPRKPVTEKPRSETPSVKSEPTAEGQANRQKAEEEIRKGRAEKRAKMEETKKNVRDRIATDTIPAKK
jgi:hypothetical protein